MTEPITEPMTESVSPRAARSRAKILAAATDLLVESGPRSVTVDAVEAASGVAKSTLYRHFDSRDDLLLAVVRSCLPDVDVPEVTDGFEPALRGLVRAAADSFADPRWARIFPAIVSLRTSMPELGDVVDADKADRQEALAAVIGRGVDEGVLAGPIDLDVATNLLVGPLVLAGITPDHGADIDTDTGDTTTVTAMRELADRAVDGFIATFRA